jgi:glycerol-3-phosphate acyltransferase PlsY
MVIDIGKGILAVAAIAPLAIPGVGIDPDVPRDLVTYSVALGAIVGHVFPVWFDFRGGKGGATAAGLLCYFAPAVAAPVIGVWLAIVFFSGYVGIATVTAAIAAALFIGASRLPEQAALFVFACLVGALIGYTHRSNIKRMLDGTESRFGRYFGLK